MELTWSNGIGSQGRDTKRCWYHSERLTAMNARRTMRTTQANNLLSRVNPDTFDEWYQEQEHRENIQNGTPFFNGPAPVQDARRHSPSALLQCQRKIAYRQLNAPEEQADPRGIFWFGTKFEEDIILPYLRETIAGPGTYVSNTLWVDFEVPTEAGALRIKGATDPVVVDRDGIPILVTEIKTKSSVTELDRPNLHHRAQIHAYLYGLSEKYDQHLTDALIVYGSRDTLNIRAFHVEFDPEFWNDTLLRWAVTHSNYRLEGDLPPADPEFDWECQFCSFRDRCGKGDLQYSDVGAAGFLPSYSDYPRSKVVDYLEAHTQARLTPTLANCYPDLTKDYEVYNWNCEACSAQYSWNDVEWSGDPSESPLCPSCAEKERYVPLREPEPEEQHSIKSTEDDE